MGKLSTGGDVRETVLFIIENAMCTAAQRSTAEAAAVLGFVGDMLAGVYLEVTTKLVTAEGALSMAGNLFNLKESHEAGARWHADAFMEALEAGTEEQEDITPVPATILDAIDSLKRYHHVDDEDHWYSCPKTGLHTNPHVTGCTCGADAHNAAVEKVKAQVGEAIRLANSEYSELKQKYGVAMDALKVNLYHPNDKWATPEGARHIAVETILKLELHDDLCAIRRGHPCNCPSAAFKR